MKFSHELTLTAWAGICLAQRQQQQQQQQLPEEAQYIFSNPPSSDALVFKIPTPYESAVQGRRILALTPLATIATVFPSKSEASAAEDHGEFSATKYQPDDVGGMPHGLMEYVADCEGRGNPTLLAIKIASSFKNARAGSNVSLAMRWAPPYPPDRRIESSSFVRYIERFLPLHLRPWTTAAEREREQERRAQHEGEEREAVPYSAANLPRFSLMGYLEDIEPESVPSVSACFVRRHPDAKYWLPGNRIHASRFVRLVVRQAYWIGGFGDRAYIGWLSPADWGNVTDREWQDIRLPGEKKGWKEWALSNGLEL